MTRAGRAAPLVALMLGCTSRLPPGDETALRSPAVFRADSAHRPLCSVAVSPDSAWEASFWVLPPRLEHRFARWLCGRPPRGGAFGAGEGAAQWWGWSPRGVRTTGLPEQTPWRLPEALNAGMPGDGGGEVSPYDDLIRDSAARHELDWLLIAALIFHESGFNPCLASSAGAVGLAQVLPSTAMELGIFDPWEPGQNIEAGVRYLRRMYDAFGRLEERDRVAMALASYTAGLGHVLDACSLAAADGGDPTLWSGNVEETLALLSNPDYALRATHGGACGHQAVAFVNLVLDRWEDYAAAAALKREMVEDSAVGNR